MRAPLLPLFLLGLAACSREPALLQAGSAMAPPPSAATAQAAPAASPSTLAPANAGQGGGDGDPARPAAGTPSAAESRDESRWVDVDPSQLDAPTDPALAEFQSQQRQRDEELMQRDAEEAGAMAAAPRREDAPPGYPQAGYPPPGYPPVAQAGEDDEPLDRIEQGYDYPPEERARGEYDDPGVEEALPPDADDVIDPDMEQEFDPRDGRP